MRRCAWRWLLRARLLSDAVSQALPVARHAPLAGRPVVVRAHAPDGAHKGLRLRLGIDCSPVLHVAAPHVEGLLRGGAHGAGLAELEGSTHEAVDGGALAGLAGPQDQELGPVPRRGVDEFEARALTRRASAGERETGGVPSGGGGGGWRGKLRERTYACRVPRPPSRPWTRRAPAHRFTQYVCPQHEAPWPRPRRASSVIDPVATLDRRGSSTPSSRRRPFRVRAPLAGPRRAPSVLRCRGDLDPSGLQHTDLTLRSAPSGS